MLSKSVWNQFESLHTYPSLKKDITADVAIIEGGVTGISTARLLAQEGINGVVLESRKVGGGTTIHSTGNLYFTVDKNLSQFHGKYDSGLIRKITDSRSAALNQIENWVNEFNLDCDFKRVPWILYSGIAGNNSKIEKEFAVTHGIFVRLGIILLLIYAFTTDSHHKHWNSIIIFPIAAIGGIYLFIRDLKKHHFKLWILVLHASLGLFGIIWITIHLLH